MSFVWVKGHSNNKENERCDFLAVSAAEGGALIEDKGYEKDSQQPPSLFKK